MRVMLCKCPREEAKSRVRSQLSSFFVPAVKDACLFIWFWFLVLFFPPNPLRNQIKYFNLSMSDNDDIEVDSDADKRAHHNALERKRRDHIKDSFHSLRDSVPALQGEKDSEVGSSPLIESNRQQSIKQASRAQILDKATEYIQYMRRKNHTHQQDIDDLKRQNALLEQQVRALEKAKGNTQLQANYSSSDSSLYTNPKGSAVSAFDGGSDSSSESEPEEPQTRKKPRVEANQNHPARQ